MHIVIKIKYSFWDGSKREERTATFLGVGQDNTYSMNQGKKVELRNVFWVFDKAGHLIAVEPNDVIQVISE